MWSESMAINSVKRLIKALLYPWYEKRLLRKLDFTQTPHHIGIIVDGNRRWAKANTVATKSGHQAGANKISEFLSWCEDAQVKIVTVWLLSTDNFKRSQEELDELLKDNRKCCRRALFNWSLECSSSGCTETCCQIGWQSNLKNCRKIRVRL
jgi:undecaprenyl pyrophosphate synthase